MTTGLVLAIGLVNISARSQRDHARYLVYAYMDAEVALLSFCFRSLVTIILLDQWSQLLFLTVSLSAKINFRGIVMGLLTNAISRT
jgi:hypothetical protein